MMRRLNRNFLRASRASQLKAQTVYMSTAPMKSWVPTENDTLQKITTQALIHEVSLQQMESAATVVPWFLKNMPASYFRGVPEESRNKHLKAIAAIRELKQSDLSLKIETNHADGTTDVTFISSSTKSGLLHNQIEGLVVPDGSHLSRVKVFSSLDGELSLNMFSFENSTAAAPTAAATREDAARIFAYAEELKAGKHASDASAPKYDDKLFNSAALEEYLSRVSPLYAQPQDPRRFLIQRQLFEKVRGTDGTSIHIEHTGGSAKNAWISIAAANVLPEVLLRLCSSMINVRKLDIVRAHLDTVKDPENNTPEIPGEVTMLRLRINDPTGADIDLNSAATKTLLQDLRRAKWLDESTTDLGLKQYPNLGVNKAEIITALCNMLHGPLSKINPQAYASPKSLLHLITSSFHFLQEAEAISELFLDRFRNDGTAISEADFKAREQAIRQRIERWHHEAARVLVLRMLDAVKLTLRTNFYNEDRYALSMRMNPVIMASGNMGQVESRPFPFGVFFVHGRHFNAFHCRFRDIARGGLRIVTPNNSDQYALESARHFDEVYGLSYAQQLKNKDIPEGGSKGVLLVNSPVIAPQKRFFAARKCVKAFTDSLLDLIVTDSVSKLVDHYGKDELIYLGPDEQIIPSDIDWICHRAAQRGYPCPAAFMSSKKGAGINHKEYGVTSEGVVVYLDVALRKVLNIDPTKDSFSVKITGGPDGDVAGNLMKILDREYGNNCKILAIADGFGVAEDPKGLDHGELLRLFREALPITHFNPAKLSSQSLAEGCCIMDASTEEGLSRRNSMVFRIKSDAFVPAGGRPNTINGDNWRQFIDPATGKPSSPLIVEGANIFTTPEARKLLHENAGVAIVKDSSANKCGVVTSSCEVAASMLLSKEEFLTVKDELVSDVVVHIKNLAKYEAELLFREFKNYPGALPHFSERISFAIAKVTDAITDSLADVQLNDPLFQELLPLVKDNLPKKLADVAWDRVPTRFPVQYMRNAIASTLASKLVYQEGIHLVETQPTDKIAERAIAYYRADVETKKLIGRLTTSTVVDEKTKETVLSLLRRGGARSALDIF